MNPRLVGLLRSRVLPLPYLAPAALFLLALGVRELEIAPDELSATWSLAPDELLQRAAAQRSQLLWTWTLLLFTPLLFARCARWSETFRRRDAHWFGALPVARTRYAIALVAALVLAALLALAPVVAVESWRGRSAPATGLHRVRTLEHPSFLLQPTERGYAWKQTDLVAEELAPGSVLEVRATVAPGAGPAATLRVEARDEHGATSAKEARIFGRRSLRVPVPADGSGALTLSIERRDGSAVLALPANSIDVLAPVRSPARGAFTLASQTALVWIASGLVVAWLGTVMRAGYATCCGVALVLLPHLELVADRLSAWPGASLGPAWLALGRDLVPLLPGAAEVASATAVALLAWIGLARSIGRGADGS